MRLRNFLLEDNEEIKEILNRDCKLFLNEFKNKNKFYRGTSYDIDDIEKIQTRKDRMPKDMPVYFHEELDKAFNKKFGWKPRSQGVFSSPDHREAFSYGDNIYLVFPIGKYKYIWSPKIRDLWNYFSNIFIQDLNSTQIIFFSIFFNGTLDYDMINKKLKGKDVKIETKFKKYKKENINEKSFLNITNDIINESVKMYTDKNAKDNKENEIVFKCNEYYLVNSNVYNI